MPRKPWVKLSTGVIASTTWKATLTRGWREFTALLVLADENGVVDSVNVAQLPLTVYYRMDARCTQKVRKSLAILTQIGSILQNADGSIKLPKYREYQYLQGMRSDLKPPEVAQLPLHRAEQNRAEQNRTEQITTTASPSGLRAKEPSATANLIAIFCEEYKTHYRQAYVVQDQDAGQAKRLAKNYPISKAAEFRKVCKGYFRIQDRMLQSVQHSLTMLPRYLNSAIGSYKTAPEVVPFPEDEQGNGFHGPDEVASFLEGKLNAKP